MKKRALTILVLVLFLGFSVSCNPSITHGRIDQSIPEADLVYFSIEKDDKQDFQGKEVIGFYSLKTQLTELVDYSYPLIRPSVVNNSTLIAIERKRNPGLITASDGYLFSLNQGKYTVCKTESTFGDFYSMNHNFIAILALDGINLINSADCSKKATILTNEDIAKLYPANSYLGPFTLSKNLDFIIMSSYGRLIKIDLPEKKFTDYKKFGQFPALSPDQTKIAYLGFDGIHVSDITGENDYRVIKYRSPDGVLGAPFSGNCTTQTSMVP